MKLTGKELRGAMAAVLADVPEKYIAEALGIDRATVRYWKSHRPAPDVAEALVTGTVRAEPPVKAVQTK
jgi:FixJ family two-component response regulator